MNTLTATTTFYPTSMQFKLAIAIRKPRLAFARARFPVVYRVGGSFVSLVVRGSAVNGNGVEQRSSDNSSWNNSKSSAEGFSGWSIENNERQTGDSEPKKSLAGVLAAGAAGLVLVAGLTFTALSMSSRSTPKVKEQLEPLTTEQALDSESDISQNHVGEDRVGTGEESKTVISDDPSLYKKNSGESSDGNGVRKSYEDGGVSLEDLRSEPAISDGLVSPEVTDVTPSSDATGGSSAVPIIQSKNENIDFKHAYESDNFVDTEVLEPSAEPASSLNIYVKSESKEDLESGTSQEKSLESGNVVSANDVEQSKEAFTMDTDGPNKNIETSLGEDESSMEKLLNETVTSDSSLVSEVLDQTGSGTLGLENDYNHFNVSQSLFDSENPGNFFTSAGIPAPSVVSAALQTSPGKVLVPAAIDQLQSQALSALQVLKVIEDDVQPGDICSRREYARWLVLGSSALSRNSTSKVYPAMYIENVSELAFDDITPQDPDFPFIQGLAEAGLIASKISRRDMQLSTDEDSSPIYFFPESPLTRQDVVSWKMALEKRQLPVVNKKALQLLSGFIDVDKINPDAWPALVADLAAGEQSIITLAFGYTRLFQPEKLVTKAQAAIALSTGDASAIVSEELARIEAETMAERAVAVHSALVAQVEKDINASYEEELALEREKINAVEKMAEEARLEIEKLRAAREEEKLSQMKDRAAVDSEMELLSRLRREMEGELQTLISDKLEISFEKERLNKLRADAETEKQEISRLQYELEVERRALSVARAWAEDEAKRAKEQARALDEARDHWEKQGLKVVVDKDLQEEAEGGVSWVAAGQQLSVEETIERSETIVDKLKGMANEVRGKCKDTIIKVIEKIDLVILNLKKKAEELKGATETRLSSMQQRSAGLTSSVKDSAKRVAGDWKEGVERLSQRFKA